MPDPSVIRNVNGAVVEARRWSVHQDVSGTLRSTSDRHVVSAAVQRSITSMTPPQRGHGEDASWAGASTRVN
jgi:hypothetical protein